MAAPLLESHAWFTFHPEAGGTPDLTALHVLVDSGDIPDTVQTDCGSMDWIDLARDTENGGLL